MIKENIPDWDLRTHAALYLASPTTAALYHNTPDEFWKLACWNNGIGLLPWEASKPEEEICWRDIALGCIKPDGFCEHPFCGGELLGYNRELMSKAAATGLIQPCEPACIRSDGASGQAPATEVTDREFRLEYDAHLLPTPASGAGGIRVVHDFAIADEHELMDINAREYLARHPLAARSFATSIPLDSISFCYVHEYDLEDHDWSPEHGYAVTVTDVIDILQRELRHEMDRRELEDYVTQHRSCLNERRWDAYLTLRLIRTLRDTFSLCRLSNLRHICDEENAGPSFTFEQM